MRMSNGEQVERLGFVLAVNRQLKYMLLQVGVCVCRLKLVLIREGALHLRILGPGVWSFDAIVNKAFVAGHAQDRCFSMQAQVTDAALAKRRAHCYTSVGLVEWSARQARVIMV